MDGEGLLSDEVQQESGCGARCGCRDEGRAGLAACLGGEPAGRWAGCDVPCHCSVPGAGRLGRAAQDREQGDLLAQPGHMLPLSPTTMGELSKRRS